jgi:hypothetical protein
VITPALAVSVRPTRKPKPSYRSLAVSLRRLAERRSCGSLPQPPPRTTWLLQSLANHSEPFVGAPS